MYFFSQSVVSKSVLFFGCCWFALIGQACEQEDPHYSLAVAASGKQDYVAAKAQLEQSVAICSRYSNWYLLGRTLQKLNDNEHALNAYRKAKAAASTDDKRALAIARYAEVLSLSGNLYEALALLRGAWEMHSSPRQWMTDLMFQWDQRIANKPMTKDLVTRSLGAHQFGLLPSDSKPFVNIRINFEFDSTEVDGLTEQNLAALAAALAEGMYTNNKFRLIGHTDSRGDAVYNDDLSVRRAQAIQAYLETLRPELRGRIFTEGRGEHDLLYAGKTEQEHRLNRRLQVVVD